MTTTTTTTHTAATEDDKSYYVLDGVEYGTYVEMVQAKRRRNQQVLQDSGLLSAVPSRQQPQQPQASVIHNKSNNKSTSKKKKKKRSSAQQEEEKKLTPGRKSRRLAGEPADGRYVDEERAGRFSIRSSSTTAGRQAKANGVPNNTNEQQQQEQQQNVVARKSSHANEKEDSIIASGSDLLLAQAMEFAGSTSLNQHTTWMTTTEDAEHFCRHVLVPATVQPQQPAKTTTTSPPSVVITTMGEPAGDDDDDDIPQKAVAILKVTDVAKVVPDRIYSVATHPATDRLLVAAGDKKGNVGLWNVHPTGSSNNNDDDDNHNNKTSNGHHLLLFRVHTSPVCYLEWNTMRPHQLVSASYDGTVRVFDAQKQSLAQVFDVDDDDYESLLVADRDYWTQYAMRDPRADQCLFLSTSVGTAMHVDLRQFKKKKITFHQQWSDKKINTLRYS